MLSPGEEDEHPTAVVDSSVMWFCSRSVSFLKHWPIQRLAHHPQHCMFHYFNRGQVLVRDSNNSDWIYIVKSGSLSVLKKLHHAKATTRTQEKEEDPSTTGGSSSNINSSGEVSKSSDTWRHRLSRHAPRHRKSRKCTSSPEVFRNHMEADRRLEQSLPGVFNSSERLGTVDYERVINQYRARVIPKPGSEPPTLRLPTIPTTTTARTVSAPEPTSTELAAVGGDEDGDMSHPPEAEEVDGKETGENSGSEELEDCRPISKTSKGVYLVPTPSKRRHKKKVAAPDVTVTSPPSESRETSTAESVNVSSDDPVTAQLQRLNIDYQRRFREHVGRKTMADQLDHKGSRDFRYTEVDLNPMFVLVQVLERGQYFGVSQLLYPDQPSLCVVSNGAELIVLSKRLFLDSADDACMRHIRNTECPYPADEALQNRLQDYVNWEAHRARVYRRLVTDIRQRQARRNQYLPSVSGHYCFRSGPL